MRPISDYDLYIFDCDGVILDSNQLKIDAMERALQSLSFDQDKVSQCVTYFSENFGMSRFYHVEYFIDNFLSLKESQVESVKESILKSFSAECKKLYIKAEITPYFIEFITSLNGRKFVASGSEQAELREVFKMRGLDKYFVDVFGSPTKKEDLVANILSNQKEAKAVMFGDAISDLQAAKNNDIDFIAYIPFSNVKKELSDLSIVNGYKMIETWSEVL
ncbi:HAD family hydrolase [Psychromonas hadalis]|uniref:HAD family hydrolase n=1 Tax=Psychromonas hadalis TaxID=211669 RepID=UPI0003B3EA90|nr:HAD hydrolase-like protein [Psychromonas hadalis]